MKHIYIFGAYIPLAKVLLSLLLMVASLKVTAALPNESQHESRHTTPSPVLKPSEVVRIQVKALRKNTLLNEGIELTYRFASPKNKLYTGPLNRFTEMVRSAPYNHLLNHLNASYGPLSVSGEAAYQLVTIVDKKGEAYAYTWLLSRQREGKFKDCWMTDAVIPAEQPVQHKVV